KGGTRSTRRTRSPSTGTFRIRRSRYRRNKKGLPFGSPLVRLYHIGYELLGDDQLPAGLQVGAILADLLVDIRIDDDLDHVENADLALRGELGGDVPEPVALGDFDHLGAGGGRHGGLLDDGDGAGAGRARVGLGGQ